MHFLALPVGVDPPVPPSRKLREDLSLLHGQASLGGHDCSQITSLPDDGGWSLGVQMSPEEQGWVLWQRGTPCSAHPGWPVAADRGGGRW